MGKSVGRPTKFSPELIDEICGYIQNGNSYITACKLCNICKTIFYDWKRLGNEGLEKGIQNEYTDFVERIEKAEETYIAWLVQSVNLTAQVDGKLALDILSRKKPEEWGKKDKIDIQHGFDHEGFKEMMNGIMEKKDKKMDE